MKRIICLFMMMVFTRVDASEDALAVKLVANNWCPQHCKDHKLGDGYIVDLVREAFKEAGFQSSLTYLPWLRAIHRVREGQADGLLTPSESEEPYLIRHNEPLAIQRFCFYQRSSDPALIKTLDDFRSRKVAYVAGNHLGHEFMTYIRNFENDVKVDELVANYDDMAPRMYKYLLSKRADAIALTEDMGDFFIGQNKEVNKRVAKAYCTQSENLYVGFSSVDSVRAEALVEAIDKGLIALKEKGMYQKILDKYYLGQD